MQWTAPPDLQTRQLVTHIRLLQGEGLTLDQIESALLSNGPLNKIWSPGDTPFNAVEIRGGRFWRFIVD